MTQDIKRATRDKLDALAKIMVSDGALKLVTETQGRKPSEYLALGEVEEPGIEAGIEAED